VENYQTSANKNMQVQEEMNHKKKDEREKFFCSFQKAV
jgi:hypothetical protein